MDPPCTDRARVPTRARIKAREDKRKVDMTGFEIKGSQSHMLVSRPILMHL
jgi:hypothetical protein